MRMPTALDLFCGAGGLSLGLARAGFKVTCAIDAWGAAVASYRANFPAHGCLQEDVSALDPSRLSALGLMDLDLVAGGPPCQGFSIQRIGADEDDRNDLVMAFGRVVVACRPKMFVMENVTGLLGARGRPTFSRLAALLSSTGYEVAHQVLDAAAYGVPQVRRRVFVVGRRRDVAGRFAFPPPVTPIPVAVGTALSGLPSPPCDFTPMPGDILHRRTRLSPLNQQRIALVPPGGGFEDLPLELRVDCHKAGAGKIGHRSVYGRLHPDRPAGTITARFDSFTRGRFGHPLEARNLTLREGARLQGFPDSHVFLGTQEEVAAQIGNAIPPPMAAAVASACHALLLGSQADVAVDLPLFAVAG